MLNKFNLKYIYSNVYKIIISFFSFLKSFKNKKNFKKHKINTKNINKVSTNKKNDTYSTSFYNFFLNEISFNDFFKIYSLRNNIVYLKSKFSKVRPFCKNIVYFSLIINVIVINELHSIYYNISINYGYMFQILYLLLIVYSLYLFVKKNKGVSLIVEPRSSKPLISVQFRYPLYLVR